MHEAFADIMTEAVAQLRGQLEEMHALKAENERLRTELAHARDAADQFENSALMQAQDAQRLREERATLRALAGEVIGDFGDEHFSDQHDDTCALCRLIAAIRSAAP